MQIKKLLMKLNSTDFIVSKMLKWYFANEVEKFFLMFMEIFQEEIGLITNYKSSLKEVVTK